MRAVNLIPQDGRRGTRLGPSAPIGPGYLVIAALSALLLLVTIYVLTGNTITSRKAKLAALKTEVAQTQAQAAQLSSYAQFAKLAQTRAETVRQIAGSRFDWYGALSDLSKVVPADTSLQSLVGTVAPGATVQSSGSAGSSGSGIGSSLRGDEPGPAFEMTGCTSTQDEVAGLMSRLRLIDGVTRVTLGDSEKLDSTQTDSAASAVSAGAGAAQTRSAASTGCPINWPKFDLVIFFSPLPGAGPAGATPAGGSTTTGTSK